MGSLAKSYISPYYTLLHAMFLKKQVVFTHVLPRVKKEINRRICWNGSHVTPLEIAQKAGTQKMCRQIEEAGGEVSQPCWHCVREKILLLIFMRMGKKMIYLSLRLLSIFIIIRQKKEILCPTMRLITMLKMI